MDDLERKAVFLSTLHTLRQSINAAPDEFAGMLMEAAMLLAPEMFDFGNEDDEAEQELMQ